MSEQPSNAKARLQIKTPCPMSWDELVGGDKQRFCSACSLHVHNASELSRDEAHALVTQADARVCMKVEYDASGAPLFRDSQAVVANARNAPKSGLARLSRWAATAAAGVLAACHGSVPESTTTDPAVVPNAGQSSTLMGRVCPTTLLGDVVEAPMMGAVELGEAQFVPDPVVPAPPDKDQ
ncbi:MAG: hypothetical protein JNL28_11995 [Planctomycetes bacterium]|nr:hypothetical protein [Planctomycetota bacterium]